MMNKTESVQLSEVLCVLFACISIILIILSVFVACVEGFAFNRNYFRDEYEKLNAAAYVGVDEITINKATEILLDYLEGSRDNLDYEYSDNGAVREYYNGREKAHMIDVAKLNTDAVIFAKVASPLGAAFLILSYILKRRYLMWKSVFITTIALVAVFAVIGIWAAADFNTFWISFHKVFFKNDLWILDPRTSLMIRMFSSQFFFDMVVGILAIFVSVITAILIVSGLLMRKYRKII